MGTRSTPLVAHKVGTGKEGEDWRTNDDAIWGHILAGDLQPTSRSGTQVYTTSCRFQEVVLFVQLYQLERRTSSVALFPV